MGAACAGLEKGLKENRPYKPPAINLTLKRSVGSALRIVIARL